MNSHISSSLLVTLWFANCPFHFSPRLAPGLSKTPDPKSQEHTMSTRILPLLILGLVLLTTPPLPTSALKCFICEFNINYCKTPNCYTNPDICSSNQFSSVLVPIQECPNNCMLKAVTNPAGIILKWKRLCAPASDLTHGFSCRIDYVFGARIEQCTCDKDYCNSTSTVKVSAGVLAVCLSIWLTSFLRY